MSTSSTVFIVDDDRAARESLRALLEAAGYCVSCYPSAEAFLEDCDPGHAGCLVTDVAMPGLSGLELADVLAARGVRLPIVFLTGYGTVSMSVRAMKKGAIDFLEKPVHATTLIRCVWDAILRDREQRDAGSAVAAACEKLRRLTPREQEVMTLALAGLTSKVIARRLAISHRTVELHRTRAMRKLAAGSLLEAASIMTTAGWAIPGSATFVSGRPDFNGPEGEQAAPPR
ncbi:MAG: response regulator transcription factor [Burkholderiales bacterium]|nr:response regulator transcription factor [Burkholderiales bacterium]